MGELIYKIVEVGEWQQAIAKGRYSGSADDRRDGYIHLSTRAQLEGTLAKHFAGRDGLLLVAVQGEKIADRLKWEPARGGDLFPHCHGDLPIDAALWAKPLPRDASGRHIIGKDAI